MHKDLVTRILDQSHALVSTARMEGEVVCNLLDEQLGKIHSVMLDKATGKAAYVVMLLDNQPGRAHPLPWRMLQYDSHQHRYVVNLSSETLHRAPAFVLDESDRPRLVSEEEIQSFYDSLPKDAGRPFPIEEGDFNSQPV